MIVYIKSQSGEIYASPVFAEIGKSWNIKSVVLNKTNTSLILLPLLKKRSALHSFNYFYIDETTEDGWIKNRRISGFTEIIKNKPLLKSLKRGKHVSADGLEVMKKYNLPLHVINTFEIKTEQDISTFNTVCWGLHDAYVEEMSQIDGDIIINFNTTWEKHIILTFHNVKESRNLDQIKDVFDSTFKIGSDCATWKATDGFDSAWNVLSERQIYVVAQRITWELRID